MDPLGFAFVDYDVPELLPFEIVHVSGLDSFDEFLLFYWESVELKFSVDEAWDLLFE